MTNHEEALTDREQVVRQALGATDATTHNGGVQDLDQRAREVVAALDAFPTYVPPERPVELRVAIEDEDGVTIEQTLALTRVQAINGTKLGYALVGAARCVLQAYYGVTDDVDGGGLTDALDAGVAALGVR